VNSANHLELTARITELAALRYTPAGVPALNGWLEHASDMQEAGQSRQVKTSIRFVAFGALAESLAVQAIDSGWNFSGFLASPKNSKSVVFHIQAYVKHSFDF
jgi:primosomal replication protein N